MTREEAIRCLCVHSSTNGSGLCTDKQHFEAKQMAIKALEQQPKTVLYSGDGYADGYMVYDMAKCPTCGYEYENGDKDWGLSFCPNCGQKLNWESEG